MVFIIYRYKLNCFSNKIYSYLIGMEHIWDKMKEMAKRIITKIGDIFSVDISGQSQRYFQYIANDLTQLNSDVIRVFKRVYPKGGAYNIDDIANDEIDFYAHCVIKWGIKLGFWQKIGNSKNIGKIDVLFRDSDDYGKPEVIVSEKWYVWKINEEFKNIGKVTEKYKNSEIGIVISPENIVKRIKSGSYDFVYPKFE